MEEYGDLTPIQK